MKNTLLVFGASGVLGSGVLNVLRQKQYDRLIVFSAANPPADPLANEIYVTTGDLSKEENVTAAFSGLTPDAQSHFFLFSSIGGYSGGTSIGETPVSDWETMFSINVTTHFLLLKEFSRLVRLSAGGSACITSALTGLHPEAFKTAYGSSKAALNYLVQSVALEGESINLSVNALAPFIIDTPGNRSWVKPEDWPHLIKPEEVGNLVYALFQNYRFVSGNVLSLRHRFAVP